MSTCSTKTEELRFPWIVKPEVGQQGCRKLTLLNKDHLQSLMKRVPYLDHSTRALF